MIKRVGIALFDLIEETAWSGRVSLDGEVPDQRVVELSADGRKSRIVAPQRKAAMPRIVLLELCSSAATRNRFAAGFA